MVFYTVWMSRYVDQYVKIYCSVPDDQNYLGLQINIALNQIESIIKTNILAASDSDGWLKFT
jgi:hypothetical protein